MSLLAKNKKFDQTILTKVENLNQSIDKIKLEIENLEKNKKSLIDSKVNVDEAANFFKDFKNNLNTFNKHLQKEAVRSVIRKIILSESLITVEIFCGYQVHLNNSNFLEKNIKVLQTNKHMFNLENFSKNNLLEFRATSGSPSLAPTPPWHSYKPIHWRYLR